MVFRSHAWKCFGETRKTVSNRIQPLKLLDKLGFVSFAIGFTPTDRALLTAGCFAALGPVVVAVKVKEAAFVPDLRELQLTDTKTRCSGCCGEIGLVTGEMWSQEGLLDTLRGNSWGPAPPTST